jgi:hypothetical protein
VFPPGYQTNVIRKDRNSHGGGIFIIAKDDISLVPVQLKCETCPLTIGKLQTKNERTHYVGAFYRTPNSNVVEVEELLQNIEGLRNNTGAMPDIILGGDFNLPSIEWGTHSSYVKPSPQYCKTVNDLGLELVNTTGLTQVVQEPTRGNNILDLMFVLSPDMVKDTSIIPGIGDHEAVCLKYDCQIKRVFRPPRKVLLFSRMNTDRIRQEIRRFQTNFSTASDNRSASENWNAFTNFMKILVDQHIPQKTIKGTRLPWISPDILSLMQRRNRARTKAKNNKQSEHWKRYLQLQKEVKHKTKEAHKKYVESVFNESQSEKSINKKVWSYIKAQGKDHAGIPPLEESNNDLVYSARGKANLLSRQYSSVFTTENPDIPTLPEAEALPEMDAITVKPEGIAKLLKELEPKKAAGPDGIPTRLLKDFYEPMSNILAIIFQQSLNTGDVPEDWKKASIVPIFKKGKKSRPENYRPVSLTSVCCKILEHVVYTNIMKHLDKHNVLIDQQHGFRRNRGCETQLLTTLTELEKTHHDKYQQDIIILDFQKAFDKVPHKRLLTKMEHTGIRKKTHLWIKNWLTNRNQRVLVEGQESAAAPVLSGVPQGTVLGPLLFLIYINDITKSIQSTIKLFADDALLYRKIENPIDHDTLQEDLDKLCTWADVWQMSFNIQKCYVMRTKRGTNLSTREYSMKGQVLESTQQHPYLGLMLSNDFTWNKHIDQIVTKATRTLNLVRRNFSTGTTTRTRNMLYKSFIRPKLEYCNAIWDPHTKKYIDKLEAVQNKSARFISKNYNRYSSITEIKLQLELQSLQERRFVNRQKLLYKTIHEQHAFKLPGNVKRINRTTRHHNFTFKDVIFNSRHYQFSFLPRTIRCWNLLPPEIVNAKTTEEFTLVLTRNINSNKIAVVPPCQVSLLSARPINNSCITLY